MTRHSVKALWLVRHAQPVVVPGTCYGQTDVPADGHATSLAADALVSQLPPGAVVYSSPLSRAKDLAQALFERRADLRDAGIDNRLGEMDFGDWEMRLWDHIDPTELQAWSDGFADYRCGGGESAGGLVNRVSRALNECSQVPGPVVWVTHAGVVSAVRHLTRRPLPLLTAANWPPHNLGFGASWVLAV